MTFLVLASLPTLLDPCHHDPCSMIFTNSQLMNQISFSVRFGSRLGSEVSGLLADVDHHRYRQATVRTVMGPVFD
jgi:hypothetical protein